MSDNLLIPKNGGMLAGDIQRLVLASGVELDAKWAMRMDEHKEQILSAFADHKDEVKDDLSKLQNDVRAAQDDLCTLVGDSGRGLPGMIPEQGRKIDALLSGQELQSKVMTERAGIDDVFRTEVKEELAELKGGQKTLEDKTSDLQQQITNISWFVTGLRFMGSAAGHVGDAIRGKNTVLIVIGYIVTAFATRQGINSTPYSGLHRWIATHPYLTNAVEVTGGILTAIFAGKTDDKKVSE